MPDELAQAPQEPAPEEGQGGGQDAAQTLITGVAMAMGKVAELLPKLQASEEDMAAMEQVIGQYKEVIQRVLGGGEAPQKQQLAQMPVEAGATGVPMGQ